MLDRNAPVMLDRDFDGVRTQIKVFLKDMGLIQDLTKELGIDLPGANLAYNFFIQAVDKGLGDMDAGASVKLLEEQTGCVVERKTK